MDKEATLESEDPDKLYAQELDEDGNEKKPKGKGKGRGRGRGRGRATGRGRGRAAGKKDAPTEQGEEPAASAASAEVAAVPELGEGSTEATVPSKRARTVADAQREHAASPAKSSSHRRRMVLKRAQSQSPGKLAKSQKVQDEKASKKQSKKDKKVDKKDGEEKDEEDKKDEDGEEKDGEELL